VFLVYCSAMAVNPAELAEITAIALHETKGP
jgi:hypothetical protein